MIRSIRRFLLISLLLSITVASSITAIGNYLTDKQVIQPYLDDHLIEVYSFIETLEQFIKADDVLQKKISRYIEETPSLNPRNIFFQIWDNHGNLLLHSPSRVAEALDNAPLGLSDWTIDENDWRVYASLNTTTHHKVVVAELYDLRNRLADDITRNNAYILLVTYPIFGMLIWAIIGFALRSVSRVTSEISHRASTHLEPVDAAAVPIEVKPLVIELNQLFLRLQHAFDRNKRFAADAAHELKTPLAAIKTQAQVALKADTAANRGHALHKMIEAIDRSSHVVTQLLILSRLAQEEALTDIHPMDMHKVAMDTIAFLVPIALEKQIDIELIPAKKSRLIMGNEITLGILIRNIVDNAIRYTPEHGNVKIALINEHDDKHIVLRVTDTGPGIPPELRERVFERFYRIVGNKATGSGLGLAIVTQIAELHYARIDLTTLSNGVGLQFDITFPVYHQT